MTETILPDRASDVPCPTPDQRVWVPDASMLPGNEKPTPAAVGLLKLATQGAHDTIDRIADSAAPAVQHLGDSVAAAEEALKAKANQLRDTGDAWVDNVRTTVRGNPLVSVAAAFALGAAIARFTR